MNNLSLTVSSTPSNPATLARRIGDLEFELSADGLVIRGLPRGPLALTVEETMALSDFWRTPGARSLAARTWLAHQHLATLTETP